MLALSPWSPFDLSDALRTSGLLPYVLSIAMKWPAVDVPANVAVAAVWVLAHASAGMSWIQVAASALVQSLPPPNISASYMFEQGVEHGVQSLFHLANSVEKGGAGGVRVRRGGGGGGGDKPFGVL